MDFLFSRRFYSCRNCLAFVLISYVSFAMLLLLHPLVNDLHHFEISQNPSAPIRSPRSHKEFPMPLWDNRDNVDGPFSRKHQNNFKDKMKDGKQALAKSLFNYSHSRFTQLFLEDTLNEPVNPSRPADTGDSFYHIFHDVYVYSAFLDDRKDDVYIRLLTLSSASSSKTSLFCHFSGEIFNVVRKGQRYELCENHNRMFGGYIFSCQVPEFLESPLSNFVNITWGHSGSLITVPLLRIKPPEHRVKFLNSYVGDHFEKPKNIPIPDIQIPPQATIPSLSFAICVPPLFGDISPHRLIEFIELSLLLGAQHIFLYKYSIPQDALKVISHYISRGVVTLLPWALPSLIKPDRIWYYGQLLAHNDCLYRAMPIFDLIAFNDMDEFIVPHQNKSKVWNDVFPILLTNGSCGWSFQSAFYDPGIVNMRNEGVVTPELTARSSKVSKIRTKVMVSPWRVFEVGIHHVSKQNRENWLVHGIEPSRVLLHHYRRCVGNYDMNCQKFVKDTIIEDHFGNALRNRYNESFTQIMT